MSTRIAGIAADEPVKSPAAKDRTAADAKIKRGKATAKQPQPKDKAMLRAERQVGANGNWRVYTIHFEADDGNQACTGAIKVEVPSSKNGAAVEDADRFDPMGR